MKTGYSRSPKLLKGADSVLRAMLILILNIIIFQIPEFTTRQLTPWRRKDGDKDDKPDAKSGRALAA